MTNTCCKLVCIMCFNSQKNYIPVIYLTRLRINHRSMQSLNKNKNKKVKVKVKNIRFKKLSMFQLQNCAESGIWGNWVNKKSI